MKSQFRIVFLCCFICSCTFEHSDDVEEALKRYDNSLDSLIVGKTTNKSKYTILYGGDTLDSNPKRVVEYFVKTENNSTRDSSTIRTSIFKNNRLTTFIEEDEEGEVLIEKILYFDEEIDNSLLANLRVKNKDTSYVGVIAKFNDKGYLLKSVSSSKIRLLEDDDFRDARTVSVFQYDTINNRVISKSRFYLQNGFLVDSLKQVTIDTWIEPLIPDIDSTLLSEKAFKYDYQYDTRGNWIVKRTIFILLPEEERIYKEDYREISY